MNSGNDHVSFDRYHTAISALVHLFAGVVAKDDISDYYSSAKFYETGIDEFGFLNNLFTVFDGE
jgi:hypothetical protein